MKPKYWTRKYSKSYLLTFEQQSGCKLKKKPEFMTYELESLLKFITTQFNRNYKSLRAKYKEVENEKKKID